MEKKPYINVDELMPQVSLEQAANYYGLTLPEVRRVGSETRTACFLKCGKEKPTGDRVLAIQAETATKTFFCHNYGCGKSGNLISLCDMMKPGSTMAGRPRGDQFKKIAADLKAMVSGEAPRANAPAANPPSPAPPPPKVNVPLKISDNERARGLVTLDEKFVIDPAAMNPKAASYFRRRPFLSPEVCRQWRLGYLSRDVGGEDKTGGTMRGKVVYPYQDASGEILTWFGRDPEFEEKRQKWEAGGRTDKEPEKFHFVKGFHRGQELFGIHRLREQGAEKPLHELGLILVEGPNDAIRLATLGVPAVALCSNTITREQADKAAALARELARGIVTIFLDCDDEGESGMKQCLGYLAQLTPVRLAWTSRMHGGAFKGRQPESLTIQEWQTVEAYLRRGTAKG
jgi:5S rRNA maturation endonuclease (ribonuclease M5)